jgi:[glutamine synthetase] adenylyltransferase / [glutamine synthetase]-adenylyl-L-tyrosine phosphorylase
LSYENWPERLAPALAIAAPFKPTPEQLSKLAHASDFAIDVLQRQPELLGQLQEPLQAPNLPDGHEPEWPRLLRRWRQAQSVKLIWRDLQQIDTVEQTLAGSSWIAEQALSAACTALYSQMQREHGDVRDVHGQIQHFCVLALGKLGGGELNFSSDVDLVYAFTDHGQSDGARPLSAETFFTRLGQRLTALLDEVTADGFCHRVDLRLRPFGASGRLVLSFNAMEHYFQSSGRDWERYAWLKARPVAGNLQAGQQLLRLLKPFVFRRYLDFTAIDGLRDMKAKIEFEVQRREKVEDLKLGRGGIREIEFLVQALQIIHGGRTPSLQLRGLLPSLAQLKREGLITNPAVECLRDAYLFLRQLENRVQMLRDEQVHQLPENADDGLRIAQTLGYADIAQLQRVLNGHRAAVELQFSGLLGGKEMPAAAQTKSYQANALTAEHLQNMGFARARDLVERLQALLNGQAAEALSERSRQRLQQVAQALCQACSACQAPDAAIAHAIRFLQATVKRSSYIALLDERPQALVRLVRVFEQSPWMAQQLIDHPLLLDELLDARLIEQPFDASAAQHNLQELLTGHKGDVETAMLLLNEFKLSAGFRIAYQFQFQQLSALQASRHLSEIAECVLQAVLSLAHDEMQIRYGGIVHSAFAVLGYGSLGARSLAFNSDLDLVFICQSQAGAQSSGAQTLEAPRYFMRLAQKLMALLNLSTPSGSLFDVDIRLRPDGAKGLLVSAMESFSQYQLQRAWVWEWQALVRARAVAGDAELGAAFEQLRLQILRQSRSGARLREEIQAMRRKMRAELNRSDAQRIDLKHGHGALTDIEFLLQALLLQHSAQHPALALARDSSDIITALCGASLLSADQALVLQTALAMLQALSLHCHLDLRPRISPVTPELQACLQQVRQVCLALGFDFS